MYRSSDYNRAFQGLNKKNKANKYRSEFRIDYSRLIHSPSFRRLQGKTQLFPGDESDFFRNRLTHSLEVAQIAKSIALKINFENRLKGAAALDTDLVEFAGLAHDLGHPPFGHQGEIALHKKMLDCGGFEGNAQTLRILSKLEKKELSAPTYSGVGKDCRVGLNLTYRSLAAIIKYDKVIPKNCPIDVQKGYYLLEQELVEKIKEATTGSAQLSKGEYKTVECQIMDIADDIAYSTYDLEDTLKAGFASFFDYTFGTQEDRESLCNSVNHKLTRDKSYTGKSISVDDIGSLLIKMFGRVFLFDDNLFDKSKKMSDQDKLKARLHISYFMSKEIARNGFLRTTFSSALVDKYVNAISFERNNTVPCLSKVKLSDSERVEVEILKTLTYNMQINSSKLKIVEFRGSQIVGFLFDTLTDEGQKGYELLPEDYRKIYVASSDDDKKRVVCDFICGMTDKYAIEFYGRLTSENPETIFKPL